MEWPLSADNASLLRIASFVAVFAAVALLEVAAPRRSRQGRGGRWPHNLGLLLLDVAVLRVLLPGAAIAVALVAEQHGAGLLHTLAVPSWAAIAMGMLVLDLTIYLQHVLFHAVPVLWRLHRVHHTDSEIDVTTGIRFHPIEILLSTVLKCAAVAAVGAPPFSVLLFEVILNASAMFNHGNFRIPLALDRALRWLIVTPDMHRVHHSVDPKEQFSNYGFNLTWWDRLFGSYRSRPAAEIPEMPLGVAGWAGTDVARLDRLLVQPLLSGPTGAGARQT